ncbi:hypothetical protein GOP47_0024118 [Adiantum capillus-veneris]|uniref:Dirigent protein n=1 Tax=Adiantum capillus-veneris TaxID=13818 RepID=A0A9D4Z400_ADICA|nr:hypothetical protein GOP47_0024118 [Adiantum capillus-veneris]
MMPSTDMAVLVQLGLSFIFFLLPCTLPGPRLQGVMATTYRATKTSPSRPKSLDFYMYIAVQNNSNLGGIATFTAVQSAQPNPIQPFSFGTIHTFDNPLYSTASLTSASLGRAQGWYGNTGKEVLTLFLVQTFSFLSGPNNGTLSLMGVDVATDTVKYGAIVGGTGDFSCARGVATQTLVSSQIVDQQTVSWFRFVINLTY